MDALGQKSLSVPQKSSCACGAKGIDQMWVWGAAWGRLRSAVREEQSSAPQSI